MKNWRKNWIRVFAGIFLMSIPTWFLASAANISGDQKYAEDSIGGYVNLGVQQDGGENDVGGITVSNTQVTGQMWSENLGWIEMQPDEGGVSVTVSGGQGTLDGEAWAEQVGWIYFGAWDDDPDSGVYIDADGYFQGVAWSENYGSISFGDYMLENSVSTQYTEAADKGTYWARTSWRPTLVTVSNDTLNGAEDTTFAFQSSDFTNNFDDPEGGSLTQIQINTLPANGTLNLNTTAITVDQEVLLADLGNLNFEPTAAWSGVTSFDWKGNNGSFYTNEAATMSLNIRAAGQRYAEGPNGGVVDIGVLKDAGGLDVGGITVANGIVSGQMWVDYLGWIEMQPDVLDPGERVTVAVVQENIDGVAGDETIGRLSGTGAIGNGSDGEDSLYGFITFGQWDSTVPADGTPDADTGVYIDPDGYFQGVAWSDQFGEFAFGDYMLENSVSNTYTDAAEDKGTYWARTDWRPNAVPTVSNATLNGTEDTDLDFVAANFTDNFDDTDGDSLTKIQITGVAANGTLKLSGSTVSADQEIVAADFGNLAFVPNGNWNGDTSFQWKGNDGSVYSETAATMTLSLTAVNDVPSFTLGSDPTVNEDAGAQSYAGWATNISAGPSDESSQTLTFNITNNTNTGLFSVAPSLDTSTGDLTYTPADNAFGSADITVTLSDNGGTDNGGDDTSDGQTFAITVSAVNDAPIVDDILDQEVTEGQSFATISLDDFVADVDDADSTLTWSTSGETDLLVSITDRVATINIPNENWTGNETITFTASDQEPLSDNDAATFTVTAVNDAPVLANNNTLNVNKGATATIVNSDLRTTDVDIDSGDQAASDLVYTVASLPTNGELQNNGTAIAVNDTFTQANIDAENITYVHDDTETTTDSFTFTVTDGTVTLPATGANTFDISISVDNFIPTLDTNTGSTVNEGGIDTIANTELSASDADVPAQTLTYTIVSAPAYGTVRNGSTDLAQGETFTQTDIDAGDIKYAHDGSETSGDSFDFSISDGAGGQITGQTFNLTINPINDAPVNTIPGGILNVNEDTDLVITTISVSDDDAGSNDIQVVLTSTKGTVLVIADVSGGLAAGDIANNNSTSVTLTGTLTEINTTLADENAVTYSPNANVTGSATITVASDDQGNSGGGGAQTDSDDITINIVAQNDSPALNNNEGVSVAQGSTGTIVNSALQVTDPDITSGEQTTSDMVFTVTSLPSNGDLKLNGTTTLAVNDTFTQADIDAENLTYEHDNSETTSDSFNFSASDGTITLPGATFNITVTVDNFTPEISTNTGLTLDEGATATITNSELEATDQDSGQTLTFTVNTAPTNGTLRLNTTVLGDGDTFTQADIGANNVSYEHNGSETTSDSFGFSVSDGAGGQVTGQTFNITVTPVNDAPTFTPISNQGIAIGQVLTLDFAALGNPQDAEDNGLSWSVNVTNDNVDNDTQWAGAITENPADSGTFEFDPQNAGFDGKIEVTVTLTDDGTPNANSSQTGLIIDWLQNTNPEIRSDLATAYSADEDNNLILSLDDNDKSDNEDTDANLTWSVTGFDNGVVSVNGNTITFDPDGDFNGADQVTLVLTDTNNGTDSVNLDLTWNAVNDAPVNVVPASRTVDEDTDLVVSGISVSDLDAEGSTIQMQLSVVDGVITIKTDVTNGITAGDVSNNGTNNVGVSGTITALNNTLADANGVIYRGDQDFNGTDTLTVASDDQGNTGSGGNQTDSDDITINVTAVNDSPVVTDVPDQEVAEGSTFATISLDDYVVDPDNADSEISWSATGNTDLSVNITNRVATVSIPDENWTGSETITFTGEDNEPLSGSDAAVFTVTPVNDAPALENNTGITVTQGESVTVLNSNLSTTDVDIDSGDQTITDIVYTIVNNIPSNGELRLNGSTALVENDTFTQNDINGGGITYVHDNSATETDSFGFIVSDGSASIPATGNYTFDIAVTLTNQVPVLDVNDGLTLDEGATATITTSQLSASDGDEPAQTLTYTVSTTVQNGMLKRSGTILGDGDTFTQSDIEANNITYEHDGTETSSDSFEFSIDDGNGGQVLGETFDITINNVNDLPTISNIPDVSIPENTSTGIIDFTIDDEETALSSLIVSATSSDQTLVPNGNMVLTGSESVRNINITPVSDRYGTSDITITVSDGTDQVTKTFTLNVLANPVISLTDSVVEEDVGTATIRVQLSSSNNSEIRVDYATSDGTAIAGEQYLATSGTLIWGPGETGVKEFSIIILDNDLEELDKSLGITLSSVVNADIEPGSESVILEILENEQPPSPEYKSGKATTLREAGQRLGDIRSTSNEEMGKVEYYKAYEQSLRDAENKNKGIKGRILTRTNEFGQQVFAGYQSGRLSMEALASAQEDRRKRPALVQRRGKVEEKVYVSADKLEEKFITIDVSDVSSRNKYYPDMVRAISLEILRSNRDHQFRPNDPVTWNDLLGAGVRVQEKGIESLNSLKKENLPEIDGVRLTRTQASRKLYTALKMGLIDQNFDKTTTPTRGDVLKVLAEAFDLEINPNARRSSFQDIEPEDEIAPWAIAAKRAGWFKNFKSKVLDADRPISRIEFASWFVHAFDAKKKEEVEESDSKKGNLRKRIFREKVSRSRGAKARIGSQQVQKEKSDIDRHLIGRQYNDNIAPDSTKARKSGWSPINPETSRPGPLILEDRSENVRKPIGGERIIRDPGAAIGKLDDPLFPGNEGLRQPEQTIFGEMEEGLNVLKQTLFGEVRETIETDAPVEETVEEENDQTTSSDGLVH